VHALLCIPEVYRYLCDGAAPPRSVADEWIDLNGAESASRAHGLWLLVGDSGRVAGCVALGPAERPRSCGLDYLLHPEFWGVGLATRMSWTVVEWALRNGGLEGVVAGTDLPNEASAAVMRRLGMSFLRDVSYPLGPGVEYLLRHDDPAPDPLPATIPWTDPESDPPARTGVQS